MYSHHNGIEATRLARIFHQTSSRETQECDGAGVLSPESDDGVLEHSKVGSGDKASDTLRSCGSQQISGEISGRDLEGTTSSSVDERAIDYAVLSPSERIRECLLSSQGNVLLTTSGGIQSGVLLAMFARERDELLMHGAPPAEVNIPVVLIDTGDLFAESIQYARMVAEEKEIMLTVIKHALSQQELGYNMELLLKGDPDMLPEDAYDEMTKVRPVREYIRRYAPSVWIAGNRRDQAPSRSTLPVHSSDESVARLYPLADVTKEELALLKREFAVPEHPLAGSYTSVGNRSDTVPNMNGGYEKAGRHNGVKQECGLHERRVKMGATYVKEGEMFVPKEDYPITVQTYESYKA